MVDVIDRTIHKILGTKHNARISGGKIPSVRPPPPAPKPPKYRSGGKDFDRMTGHSCDKCGHRLGEDEFKAYGQWDYKCKKCGYDYIHR